MKELTRGTLSTVEWCDSEAPQRIVVLCHGFGASGTDLVGIGQALEHSLPNTYWVFPAAPLEPADMAAWGGRAWWPLRLTELMDSLATHASDPLMVLQKVAEERPEGFEQACDALCETVSLVRNDFAGLPLVLGGFSQGAMLTSAAFASGQAEADALAFFSGCPIDLSAWREDATPVPAVVSHGQFDQVLPYQAGELLRDNLLSRGLASVEFVPFAGGHEIPHPALAAVQRLISNVG